MDLNTSEFQFGPVKVHHRPPQKNVKKVPSSYGPENWISNNGIKGQELYALLYFACKLKDNIKL